MCITLGRPPAIPDNWINTPYPLAQDESGNDTPMVVAIHRFRLRLLQSEIQERLYSPSASLLAPPPEWYDDVVRRLDDWRASLSVQTGEGSREWLNTKYHLTLLLLYRPSPCQPTPSAKGLADAMSSAGAVMRSFRELHRTGQITYSEWRRGALLNPRLVHGIPALRRQRHLSQLCLSSGSKWLGHRLESSGSYT